MFSLKKGIKIPLSVTNKTLLRSCGCSVVSEQTMALFYQQKMRSEHRESAKAYFRSYKNTVSVRKIQLLLLSMSSPHILKNLCLYSSISLLYYQEQSQNVHSFFTYFPYVVEYSDGKHKNGALLHREKSLLGQRSLWSVYSYNCGPAATRALPASFPSYFAKFLINLCARSFAFSSHSEASA